MDEKIEILFGDTKYENVTSGPALVFQGSGNEISLAEGAKISTAVTSNSTAIAGTPSAVAVMTLNGTVASYGGTGVSGGGGQMITVGQSGVIFANLTGILINATGVPGSLIDNKGSILSMASTGIKANNGDNSITNSGKINAKDGIIVGTAAADLNNKVTNSGTIVGTVSGVTMYGEGVELYNSGTIRAVGVSATYVVQFHSTGPTKLVNDGKIEGEENFAAIRGGQVATISLITG